MHLPNYPQYSFPASFSPNFFFQPLFFFSMFALFSTNRKLHSPPNQKVVVVVFPSPPLSKPTWTRAPRPASPRPTDPAPIHPAFLPTPTIRGIGIRCEPWSRRARIRPPHGSVSARIWVSLCFAPAFLVLPGFGSDLLCSLFVPLVEENLFFRSLYCYICGFRICSLLELSIVSRLLFFSLSPFCLNHLCCDGD